MLEWVQREASLYLLVTLWLWTDYPLPAPEALTQRAEEHWCGSTKRAQAFVINAWELIWQMSMYCARALFSRWRCKLDQSGGKSGRGQSVTAWRRHHRVCTWCQVGKDSKRWEGRQPCLRWAGSGLSQALGSALRCRTAAVGTNSHLRQAEVAFREPREPDAGLLEVRSIEIGV